MGLYPGASREKGRFPKTLASYNAFLAKYGAVAAHAYNLDEASGNAADLATSGAIALVPTGTPTQNVTTGLVDSDKGVTMADNTAQRLQAGANTDFDVAGGSFWMTGTTRFNTTPAATRNFVMKINTVFYTMRLNTTGTIEVALSSGATATRTTVGSHVTGKFIDWLVVLNRTSELLSLNSNLSNPTTVTTATVGSLTNTGLFTLGRSSVAAGCTMSWFAWGTTIGSLQADRAKFIADWRYRRGATSLI